MQGMAVVLTSIWPEKNFPNPGKQNVLGPVTLAGATFIFSNVKLPAREFHFEKEVMFCQINQVFISKMNYSHGREVFPHYLSIVLTFFWLFLT